MWSPVGVGKGMFSVHLAFTKQKIISQVNISTKLRYFIAISILIESADAGL